MTRTVFENKITMGNVLTAIGLILTIAFAWADLQSRQAALDRRSAEIEASADKMAAKIDSNDGRIRGLEQSDARTVARYESLSQSLGEVKAELRMTNELLRQMVQGRAK